MSGDEDDFPGAPGRAMDDLADRGIHKQGWATKCGGFIKSWKRRWFVLRGQLLHYYVSEGGEEKGTIELMGAMGVERAPECKFQPALKIDVPHRTYYMVCDTMEEVDEWIESMNTVCFPSYLG
jgi:hypothetical protein